MCLGWTRLLIFVLSLAWLGFGCQQSQIWLGHARDAGTLAADSGSTNAALPTQGTDPDPSTSLTLLDAGSSNSGEEPTRTPDVPVSTAPAAGIDLATAGSSAPAADGGSQELDKLYPQLPSARGVCPPLVDGEAQFDGTPVQLWVGPETATPGPLLLYWHGVGSTVEEARSKLGPVMDEILAQGGIVAAPASSTGRGTDTGTGTWATGDLDIADEIVACTYSRGRIDSRRIYADGCSAGGLLAGAMAFLRSSYLAAVQLNSGGSIIWEPPQDPAHMPALMVSHGSAESDIVIVNFADLGGELAVRVAAEGGFAIECNHGGGHCGTPANIAAAQWQFLQDHPFGTQPSPYAAGLPADFPSECVVVRGQ
jgi:hypothetical protein